MRTAGLLVGAKGQPDRRVSEVYACHISPTSQISFGRDDAEPRVN